MTYRKFWNGSVLAVVVLAALGATLGGPAAGAAGRRTAASGAPDCGPTVKKTLFGSWTCTFADDFNGSALDATKWAPVTTASTGVSGGPACFVDTPQNIAVYGGALHLTARQEAAPFACTSSRGTFTTQYTGGQVATHGRFSQTYGRYAVRAAFPAATVAGLQSTLWLWPEHPATAAAIGEIDFAEWYSRWPDLNVPYLHYTYSPLSVNRLTATNVVTTHDCVIGDAGQFHEYIAEWNSSTIVVKVDGQTCLVDRYRPWGTNPFAQPYFVALSQAIGQGTNAVIPGTTPLPGTTTIDYVRVWS
jgi:beta-glucanase (GH16 family)